LPRYVHTVVKGSRGSTVAVSLTHYCKVEGLSSPTLHVNRKR